MSKPRYFYFPSVDPDKAVEILAPQIQDLPVEPTADFALVIRVTETASSFEAVGLEEGTANENPQYRLWQSKDYCESPDDTARLLCAAIAFDCQA